MASVRRNAHSAVALPVPACPDEAHHGLFLIELHNKIETVLELLEQVLESLVEAGTLIHEQNKRQASSTSTKR